MQLLLMNKFCSLLQGDVNQVFLSFLWNARKHKGIGDSVLC